MNVAWHTGHYAIQNAGHNTPCCTGNHLSQYEGRKSSVTGPSTQ